MEKEKALVEKFYQLNKSLFEKAKNPLRSHGPDHHKRVCLLALSLAEKLEIKGATPDREVLIMASLLHDLAAFYPEEGSLDYHLRDYVLAKKVLERIDLAAGKKRKVLEAIKNHGSGSEYKRKDEPIETTILRDADKLEAFGSLGVARIIMARSLQGDTLNKIVDDYYTQGHLKRKWDSISAEEARQMGKESYKYTLGFFAQLAKDLKEEE